MQIRNRLTFFLWLARRQSFSKYFQPFSRFIKWVSVISIAISTCVLWVVLSVFNGFAFELSTQIQQSEPHLSVDVQNDSPHNAYRVKQFLSHTSSVKSITDNVQVYGLLLSSKPQPVVLKAGNVKTIELEATFAHWKKKNLLPARIAKSFADDIGLEIGDTLPLSVLLPGKQGATESLRVVVAEVCETMEHRFIDRYTWIVDSTTLKQALHLPHGKITHFDITLHAIEYIDTLKAALERSFPYHAYVDHTYQSAILQETVQLQRRMMFVVLSMVLVMGMFNLSTSLSMMVKDKEKELALLINLGASSRDVRYLIVLQGMMLIGLGLFIGLTLGYFIAVQITDLVAWMEAFLGMPFARKVFIFNILPSRVLYMDAVWIVTVSWILGLMSVWYPAYKASRILPAERLRYE
jgi:lipoprotein-releasing system permease protein